MTDHLTDRPASTALGQGKRPAIPPSFPALCRLAEQQHGLVSRRQAEGLGFSAKVLRRLRAGGMLTALLPAVYAVGAPPATWHRTLMSGILHLGPSAMVGGRAAAALHGFDTFRPGGLEFLTGVQTYSSLPFGTVRTSARIEEGLDPCVVHGIPCTSPLRTVFDLAGIVGRVKLEHAIDSGLRDGLFVDAELTEVLERLRISGRPGVRRFEKAISIADGPTATTVLERRFLRLVKHWGLPMPHAQVVHRQGGIFIARVDFDFVGTPVVVEVEGHATHSTRRQRQHDAERRNNLENAGKHVLVFTYEDVRDRHSYVASQVRRALGVHGRRSDNGTAA